MNNIYLIMTNDEMTMQLGQVLVRVLLVLNPLQILFLD